MSNSIRREVAELRQRVEALEALLLPGGGPGSEQGQEEAEEEEEEGEVTEPVGELEEQVELVAAYGEATAELLYEGGYTTVNEVSSASDEDLLAVPGVGAVTVKNIREAEHA